MDYVISEETRLKLEVARKEIERYENILRLDCVERIQDMVGVKRKVTAYSKLSENYGIIGNTGQSVHYAKLLIEYYNDHIDEVKSIQRASERSALINKYIDAHYLLARYEFEYFLMCIEQSVPEENKFYSSRRNVIRKDVLLLQDLEYGRLKNLAISAPPRTYKTALGIRFLAWCALRHREESSFFASHTGKMCREVFRRVGDILRSPHVKKIFHEVEIAQNAEDMWIDILPKSYDNGYHTLYFAGVDSNMAGVINCSWLLYCDDLLTEQDARNPSLVENAWDKYATGIRQRRSSNKVRELHIATRWSTKDVVSTLESQHKDDPEWKFVLRPAQDPITRESNFMFKYNPLTKQHFEDIRQSMNEIDFECIYQQNPMDKQGLLFNENDLRRFKELPKQDPDEIFCACDVAFSGTDSVAMPVAYRYGDDIYIVDVVFDSRGYKWTEPLVANMIIRHRPNIAQFEANNGGEFYAKDVQEAIKGKSATRVIPKRTLSNIGKVARIEQFEPNIKEFYFLDKSLYKPESPYGRFMKETCSFNVNGKNKHDDAPDSLAMIASMIRLKNNSGRAKMVSKSIFGL